jgi:polyhydroxyalkanoate synthase
MNDKPKDWPKDTTELPTPQEFAENWLKIAAHSQRLIQDFLQNNQGLANEMSADPFNLGTAVMEMTSQMLSDPQKLVERQMTLWQDYLKLWQATSLKMMGQEAAPVIEPAKGDKRFKAKEWTENTLFDYIKQSYLLTARWLKDTVHQAEGLDPQDARKLDFYTQQFINAMSPTNFAMTNPEVLKATIDSQGKNLVKGLENLLRDLERGHGKLAISQTDMEAFEVGKNIATTPGKVVFRNELIELIQYAPSTDTVHEVPLLIIPPWINKFYILDLKPENSLVKWLTEQGYTTFIISWRNPDAAMANTTFTDYMMKGALAALSAVQEITGAPKVSPIGYCIGGTLLAATLSYMEANGLSDLVSTATFFVAQVDFSEAGELQVFIDEEQLDAMFKKMEERGYHDGYDMAMTFNMLRSNDLIWSFVVNNYLLGKDPFPFDLLYWNSDSTRVPRAAHEFYLREMYLNNNLVKPGKIKLNGTPIDLTKIKVPTYIQAAETDHICPPASVYKATQIYSGKVRFVLAGSGHIAGVVNPPTAKKYHHWTNEALPPTLDEWKAGATQHPGSWWPDWLQWHKEYAGKQVPARQVPTKGKFKPLADAPGTYVLVK